MTGFFVLVSMCLNIVIRFKDIFHAMQPHFS
jgi:hypothetical protein